MRLLARAKVNWALAVVGDLPGGYHDLDMLMESVSLSDELTIEPAHDLSLTVDGQPAGEDNLVYRAALALQSAGSCTLGAKMALVKRIPARAGLGGGSADCAAALAVLGRLWGLGLSRSDLCAIGLTLGADVPFCLTGGLCRAQGRGERLTSLTPDRPVGLVIAMDGPGLSTGSVFSAFDARPYPFTGDMDLAQSALLTRDLNALEKTARNSLYAPALSLDDAPGLLLADMYASGALFARMTGSGAACFGVFTDPDSACSDLRARHAFCAACHTTPTGWDIL